MVPSGDKHDASDNCGGENACLPVDRKGGADSSWRGGKSIVLTTSPLGLRQVAEGLHQVYDDMVYKFLLVTNFGEC